MVALKRLSYLVVLFSTETNQHARLRQETLRKCGRSDCLKLRYWACQYGLWHTSVIVREWSKLAIYEWTKTKNFEFYHVFLV